MKIVLHGADRRVAIWQDDLVVDLHRADERLPVDLLGLIELGDEGLDRACAAVDAALASGGPGDGTVHHIGTVQLQAPAVHRPRIACAAGNFAAHTLGSALRKGVDATDALAGLIDASFVPTEQEVFARTRERGKPRGFWKDFAIPRGTDCEIPYPERCELLDYEGEVAVILGREARNLAAGDGPGRVWGVSILNDWSIREPRDGGGFNLRKNWDGSASVGPCIVVGNIDPCDLDVETRVNGELRQQYNTGDMIFTFGEIIEYISHSVVLLPGDMVSGGSGPGTATDTAKSLATGEEVSDERRAAMFLQVGDVVEVSVPEIGVLRNRVVAGAR